MNYGDTYGRDVGAARRAARRCRRDDAASAYRWALFSPDGVCVVDVAAGAVDDARAAAPTAWPRLRDVGMTRHDGDPADGSVCVLVHRYLPARLGSARRCRTRNPAAGRFAAVGADAGGHRRARRR
ncbi:MAG: hypothetical protein ACLTMP_03910 [Eggerthella lenta]